MRTAAIIQARMGSARLPGKILKDLCGKPLLWHIVHRLKQCKKLNDILIATSTNELDSKVEEFAKRYKIKVFRGSEDDVLKRYIDAAETIGADYVVRVTGDAPLIDPYSIDQMVDIITKHKAGYVRHEPDIPSVHEGFSVVSLDALKKVYQTTDIEDYHKEHVTIYLAEHPGYVKTEYWQTEETLQKPDYRLSVDNMADFRLIETIYKNLWDGKGIVSLVDVVKLLEKNPDIKSINAHVSQKNVRAKSAKIAFVIDGGAELGLGHFTRTTQIAKYMVENNNCGCFFVTNDSLLYNMIDDLGFRVFCVESRDIVGQNHAEFLELIEKEKPGKVVIDVKNTHEPENIVRALRKAIQDIKVTLIGNITNARFLADENIYPGIDTGICDLDWSGYQGRIYCGMEYFPLREEFVLAKRAEKDEDSIVVAMGGADQNNLTSLIIKSLKSVGKKIKIVIGPAFKNKSQVELLVAEYDRDFELHEMPDDYAQIVASSSLAVTAFGISIYEFAYFNTPVKVICNYKSDLNEARVLEEMGLCECLGHYKDLTQEDIRSGILKSQHPGDRVEVGVMADGVKNIAEVIVSK
jgi:spore coat polysaccharide biosynthesis protein SpsF